MSKLEIRYLPIEVSEIRMDASSDGKTVTLAGHSAVFNSLSNDLGGFKEKIRPGAFTDTLLKNPDVRFLVNHSGMPLARTKSKTLSLTQDSRGLAFVANLNAGDPDVQALLPKIKRGDVDQMSFGFRCNEDNWSTDQDGNDIRELRSVDLHNGDVSAVSVAAYPSANVGVRSLDDCEIRSLDEVRQAHKEYRSKIEAEANKAPKGMSVQHAARLLAL